MCLLLLSDILTFPHFQTINFQLLYFYFVLHLGMKYVSGSLIWSKTQMELIFNPCGEFRWSPEDPVSQIQSPHFHAGAPGIFSDLLSLLMLKREWGVESNIKHRTYLSLVKLLPWFISLQWKTYLWAELQPWFLRLQWRTCPWAEHSDDDGDQMWPEMTRDLQFVVNNPVYQNATS